MTMTKRLVSTGRAAALAGVTFRQVDHWNSRDDGLKFHTDAVGSGSRRRLELVDVLRLRAVGAIVDETGVDLDVIFPLVRGAEASELVQPFRLKLHRCEVVADLRVSVEDHSDLLVWCIEEVPTAGLLRL